MPASLYFWLRDQVAAHPAAVALEAFFSSKHAASPERWTFAELWAEVNRTARLFGGLGEHLRLAVLLPPIPEAIFACWGGMAAGEVLLLSPWQRDSALLAPLHAFGPTVLVTTGPLPGWNLWERAERLRPQLGSLRYVLQVDLTAYLGTAARLGSRIALASRKKAIQLPGQQLGDFNRSRKKLSDAPVEPTGSHQGWLAPALAGLAALEPLPGPVYLGQPLTAGGPFCLGPLAAWRQGQPLLLGPAAPSSAWEQALPRYLATRQPTQAILTALQLETWLAMDLASPPELWVTEPPLAATQPGGWRWAYTPTGEPQPLLRSLSDAQPQLLRPWQETASRQPEAVARDAGDQLKMAAGNFRWQGRLAEAIYLRGQPVWPHPLEAQAGAHESIWAVAAVPSPDPEAGEAPVLYVQWDPAETPDLAAFFAWLTPQLAEGQSLVGIRLLDEMPTLPSGEPDRLALARAELLTQAQQHLQQEGLPASLDARPDQQPGHWVLEAPDASLAVITALSRWLKPFPRIRFQAD